MTLFKGILIQQIKDASVWLPVLQEHIILTTLLSSADVYLKVQLNYNIVLRITDILSLNMASAQDFSTYCIRSFTAGIHKVGM